MKKILITGGSGRFGGVIKNSNNKNLKMFFPNKKQLNILDIKKIRKYIKKIKPDYLLHLAGLSRPMQIHDIDIKKSIDLNIIGTANITKVCEEQNIKLIYFSTNYVYPGVKGNYKENDPLLPVNNYAWSKLGGEASVQLYKNSLILRVCMTEKPFVHKSAFVNVKTSFAYHDDVVRILFKVLDQKGVLNIGGKSKYIYEFAKKDNKDVKKIRLKKKNDIGMPMNSSINIQKLNKILNK
jgi:dTDP-4-dehydrorhamnose reductase